MAYRLTALIGDRRVLAEVAAEGREDEGFVTVHRLQDCAVNRGLRHLDVRLVPDCVDEFDMVGLGPPRGCRFTEDWV